MEEILTAEMAMMLVLVIAIITVCAILGQVIYFHWGDSSKKKTGAGPGKPEPDS